MSAPKNSRKSYDDIVEAIIEALPVRSVASVQQVADEIGSSWETTWRWLELIKKIQEQPRVECIKVGKRRGELWRRERRKGER